MKNVFCWTSPHCGAYRRQIAWVMEERYPITIDRQPGVIVATVYHDEGFEIGEVEVVVSPEQFYVDFISAHPEFRRLGLATGMNGIVESLVGRPLQKPKVLLKDGI